MKKTTLKYTVDALLFISFIGIVLIGLLLAFAIAEGPVADESTKYFLNLHRHQWGNIHLYLSLAFSALAILHLILSWSWIKGKSKMLFKHRWRQLLFFFSAGGFIIVLLFWAFMPKYPGAYDNYGRGTGRWAASTEVVKVPASSTAIQPAAGGLDSGQYTITGTMTLPDVSTLTGLPLEDIIEEMNLPGGVSRKDTLGWLRKKHGFTLIDFRETIERMLQSSGSATASNQTAPQHQEIAESEDAPPLSVQTETSALQDRPAQEEHEPSPVRGRLSEDQDGLLITGQSTLMDIQKSTGIDARVILKNLNMPINTALNERLGRLRRTHGITLQEIREVIARLMEKKLAP